jgi:hypothetical protein
MPNWEHSSDARPRRVADSIPWHPSAAPVCVGPSEHPGRFEWELRSGAALAAIDSGTPLRYHTLTKRNGRGKQNRALFAPLFPSFEIKEKPSCRSRGSPFIASERFKRFGASAPGPNPQKTGAAHPGGEAAAAFNLNGQSLGSLRCVSGPPEGLSCRSFSAKADIAPLRLEGPVRFRLLPGLHTGPIESE